MRFDSGSALRHLEMLDDQELLLIVHRIERIIQRRYHPGDICSECDHPTKHNKYTLPIPDEKYCGFFKPAIISSIWLELCQPFDLNRSATDDDVIDCCHCTNECHE